MKCLSYFYDFERKKTKHIIKVKYIGLFSVYEKYIVTGAFLENDIRV